MQTVVATPTISKTTPTVRKTKIITILTIIQTFDDIIWLKSENVIEKQKVKIKTLIGQPSLSLNFSLLFFATLLFSSHRVNLTLSICFPMLNFIIKPLNSAGGKGVRLMKFEPADGIIDEICNDYVNGFVIEERIVQRNELTVFHEESINTVRVQTFTIGDHVEIKWPVLRVGRGGSIVDNACRGGVIIGIDVDSGVTFGPGVDESGQQYSSHPDTQVPLSGYQVPCWDNLCKMLKEMAMLCPDCHTIGWDMALSEKGWVVVEGNYGPEILFQYVAREGIYEDFLRIRKRLHAKRFGGYRWVNAQFKP